MSTKIKDMVSFVFHVCKIQFNIHVHVTVWFNATSLLKFKGMCKVTVKTLTKERLSE